MKPAYLGADQLVSLLMTGEGVTPERLRKARARCSDRIWGQVLERLGSGVERVLHLARQRHDDMQATIEATLAETRALRAKNAGLTEDVQKAADDAHRAQVEVENRLTLAAEEPAQPKKARKTVGKKKRPKGGGGY